MASQFKSGAMISYATVAFNAVAGLVYTPWMVSTIGANDYGLYTLAISIVNLFVLDFGLSSAVSRFLSKYYAEKSFDKANQFLGIVYKVYFVLALCIALIFVGIFFNIDTLYANLSSDQLHVFKQLFVIAALYSVLSFQFVSFDGILISNERFISLNVCNLLQKVFTVAAIVVCLLAGFGVYALVAVNAIVGCVIILCKYCLIKKQTDVKPRLGFFDLSFAREILGFSVWAMVCQVCERFVFSIMPSILAITTNTWEIAVFGLASSLESYVWTVANVLNGMMMPRVSKVIAEGDSSLLQKLMVKIGRIQVYIIGLIFIGFVALGGQFVHCWIGDEYGILVICALLLFFPALINQSQLVANTAIVAIGEVRLKALVFATMAVTNVGLALILSEPLGAMGACASICVAYLVRVAGMDVLYARKLSLKIGTFFVDTYAKWLAPALVSLCVGLGLASLVESYLFINWLVFALEALLLCAVYALLCWCIAFNSFEKSLFVGFVKKLFRRK